MVEKKKTAGGKRKTPEGSAKAPGRAKAAPAAKPAARGARRERAAAPPEKPASERVAAAETRRRPERPPAFGLHGLAPSAGATHSRKRVGRGPGSGHGKTAGRGNKGQKSRAGYRHQRGFEGGQMPLHRRVPKRGFTNIFRVEYDIVNLDALDRFDSGQAVTPDALVERRLARRDRPIKILGDGNVGKPLTVSAHRFSAAAQAKIEAAGGRCEVIPR